MLIKLAIIAGIVFGTLVCIYATARMRDSWANYLYKKNWLEKHFATPSTPALYQFLMDILLLLGGLVCMAFFSYLNFTV